MVLERAEVMDADDADDTPTPYSRGSAPMSGGTGWYGYTFSQTVAGGAERQAVVYTNVEAPATESFATAYGGLKPTSGGADGTGAAPLLLDFEQRENSDGNIEFLDEDGDIVAIRVVRDGTAAYYEDDYEEDADGNRVEGTVLDGGETTVRAEAEQIHRVIHSRDFVDEPKAGVPDLHGENRDEMDPNYLAADDNTGSKKEFWSLIPFTSSRLGLYRTDPADGQLGFRTMFDGVPGELRCVAADGTCQLERTGENPDTGVEDFNSDDTDTWIFVADNPAATVSTRRLDGDYLTIGWWIEEPVDAAGTYRFARFSTGMDPYEDDITAVTGTATYKGPAVGIWAERVRELETAYSGTFRAVAELKATFTTANIEGDAENMIGGTITNFMLDNGDDRKWRVTLADVGTEFTAEGVTGGSADGREWSGRWNGNFYGNGGTRQENQQPGHVAGSFRASFGTPEIGPEGDTGQGTMTREDDDGFVGVSGVYGATRQDD
jgi:hypothetical protein